MADVIVERPSRDREIVTSDSGAGWAVAVIIVVALAVGAFVWYQYRGTPAVPNTGTPNNINVTVPAPQTPNTGTPDTGGTVPESPGGAPSAPAY